MSKKLAVASSFRITFTALSIAVTLGACSATGDSYLGDSDDAHDSDGAGAAGLAASGTGLAAGGAGASDVSVGSGSGGGDGDTCAAESYSAEDAPVDIIIMLDRSGSMDGARWTAVTGALNNFVQSPNASGLGVSLQYFPIEDQNANICDASLCTDCTCVFNTCPACSGCSCINNVCQCTAFGGSTSCDVSDYATPDVPMGTLPQAAGAVTASLAAHTPGGGTPTGPALEGAIQYASAWTNANPSHKAAVVLATDGKPVGCSPSEIPAIASLASSALNATPSIPTFVIGVGDELADLNAIASAGGTSQAFLVDSNQNAGDQFLQALKTIQNAVLACEYLIPEPTVGDPDYNKVNVEYTPSGAPSETIPQVPDLTQCGNAAGWYYDNPADPAKIILCPASCDTAQDNSGAEISVLLGCKTVVK